MGAITENNEEISFESRLQVISSILYRGRVEGKEVFNHEIDDDLFIKDFMTRNTSSMPESTFVLKQLKRATPPAQEQ